MYFFISFIEYYRSKLNNRKIITSYIYVIIVLSSGVNSLKRQTDFWV